MQARFLVGPAGSGKTFRCLEEIRAALRAEPQGPPLVLLAPKQATFQLERQLLGGRDAEFLIAQAGVPRGGVRASQRDAATIEEFRLTPGVAGGPGDSAASCQDEIGASRQRRPTGLYGYTRLHILSFERLAKFLLRQLRRAVPALLSEEGRVMVLRALLNRHRGELRLFQRSSGLAGFARQLSLELRELQRREYAGDALTALVARADLSEALRHKLHDLALLQEAYRAWLEEHKLQDADCLLEVAASACLSKPGGVVIGGLWLDGFGELTPQELSLLAAVVPGCQKMTLAFCVDAERTDGDSWLSIWSAISQTRDDCWKKLSTVPGARLETEVLRRDAGPGRFTDNPVLRHLEGAWAQPTAWDDSPGETLRPVVCANPEEEAVLAAREILRFVHGGGRFRDVAVLLRTMEGRHDILRRVLTRYGIPFFLDRREPSAHHPLAELSRNALRVAALGWRHEDWFCALKTGLVSRDEEAVDRLENAALARGWKGEMWTKPFPSEDAEARDAERLRRQWVAPFLRLRESLLARGQAGPDGPQLAGAMRELWSQLQIGEALANLQETPENSPPHGEQFHLTVWQQMNGWLDDVEMAFAGEPLPVAEWLAILEAGLAGMTVGVIPPALDQVLVGTVDRSRNPDLQLALVLGVNEGIFPAPLPARHLLTDADCDELASRGLTFGPAVRRILSRERFLGYIACTRSRGRLVLTCAQRDADDQPLNPSPFWSHLKLLFPKLEAESFSGVADEAPVHACELVPRLFRLHQAGGEVGEFTGPAAAAIFRQQLKLHAPPSRLEPLSPGMAEQLYGPELRTSVSRLEEFAACSFRYFVHSGLHAEERVLFELDARQKGSFQHLALAEFHDELRREKIRWHDLTVPEARRRVAQICATLIPKFEEGLLAADAPSRFAARAMARSLEDFVAAMVEWMRQYDFEPRAAEVEFGGDPANGGLPGLELDLGSGHRIIFRGRIDRIDLHPEGDAAMAVVIDYKSSLHKLDPVLLRHGLQLQLPAYLSVLRRLPQPEKFFGVSRLVPAGVFYINLRGNFKAGETRNEVLRNDGSAWQAAYKHSGRFDLAALPRLDNRGEAKGTQFNYRLKNDGQPYANVPDPMDHVAFAQMLDQVEENLVRMGQAIFAGEIALNPFQKGTARACDRCEYAGICRIDPWTHVFRVLGKAGA